MKMKIILMFSLLISGAIGAQERTVMSSLGKVGNLRFTLAKSDTGNAISITQGQSLLGGNDLKIVMLYQNEIAEVVRILNTFIEETGKKAGNNTVINYRTKNLLLSCSYFKINGWTVVIQNTDPALEQDTDQVQRRSGLQINTFVQVKPGQIKDVIKIISKIQ